MKERDAYLPLLVRNQIAEAPLDGDGQLQLPLIREIETVALFADISGFTALSEEMAAAGDAGAEHLARHLNSYFSTMVRLISRGGGDVFKYAGDAMIVLWPEQPLPRDGELDDDGEEDGGREPVATLVRRALQVALEIQQHLNQAKLDKFERGVRLSCKVGIGCGRVTIAHLGGTPDLPYTRQRVECIASGGPLNQAFAAEHHAVAGQVLVSPEAWARVQAYYEGEPAGDGFVRVTDVKQRIRMRKSELQPLEDERLERVMQSYVPAALAPFLEPGMDAGDWGSELRLVSVLFVNLGFSAEGVSEVCDSGREGFAQLQSVFVRVQRAVLSFEGTINKFLVDDKGATLIAVFGLPPIAHENDPSRAVLASLAICAELHPDLMASIGVTTGVAFCGVVGSQGNRREYTVLGDVVNLAARLMQHSGRTGVGVLVDEPTAHAARSTLTFEELPSITVKGKTKPVAILRPFPKMGGLSMKSALGQHGGDNIMASMLQFQIDTLDAAGDIRQQATGSEADERTVTSRCFVAPNGSIYDDLDANVTALVRGEAGDGCGVFVLEGEIGQGKTHLLSRITAQATSQFRGKGHIVYERSDPFQGKLSMLSVSSLNKRANGVWLNILTQLLSAEAQASGLRTTPLRRSRNTMLPTSGRHERTGTSGRSPSARAHSVAKTKERTVTMLSEDFFSGDGDADPSLFTTKVNSLSIKELKQHLAARKVDTKGCLEKKEFQQLLLEVVEASPRGAGTGAASERTPPRVLLLQGVVLVLKDKTDKLRMAVGAAWKKRALWLGPERLYILEKPGMVPSDTSSSVTLEGAKVVANPQGDASESRQKFCFGLTANHWTKHGKECHELRDFLFALPTDKEL
eukprot:g1929.t1